MPRALAILFFILSAAFAFGSASAQTMPSPADGFPNDWVKIDEATCVPRPGHTLVNTIYGKIDKDGVSRRILEFTKNGSVVVRHRAKLQDGQVVGADATIMHSGRIENFASNVPGDFEKMRAAMLAALEITEKEYLACASAQH